MNQIYRNDLKKYPPLNNLELLELFHKYKDENDNSAYEKLINHNLRLVVHYANQYSFLVKDILTIDDLIAEGNIGLIEAIKNFDSSKNVKFSYYASFWIKKYMIELIKLQDVNTSQSDEIEIIEEEVEDNSDIKLKLKKALNHLKKNEQIAVMYYFGFGGDSLTLEEIGEEMNLSKQRVGQIITKAKEKLKALIKL